MSNPFESSEYNALDKAWRDFVKYPVLPHQEKAVWDKKLNDIEGDAVDLNALHAFIKSTFDEKECEKIYSKAKKFLDAANKERVARQKKEQREQEDLIKNAREHVVKTLPSDINQVREVIKDLLLLNKRDQATENIVEMIENHEFIYTIRGDDVTEMWIYREGVYVPYAKTYIQEYVRNILGEVYTTHICNQIISKIEADTFIDSKNFFSNNIIEEVPVMNGILNIYTKQLNPFDPKKIFFGKLPVTYKKDVLCPTIMKHFQTVLKNEDDIKVIQELFGFLLLKDYKIEKAVMLNGPGRNGKSKTLELMKWFVGFDNCSSVSLHLLEEDIFSTSELFGKMANICGDLNKSALDNTGRFKELTGRDLITAPRKFLPAIYFKNYAKMIFSCNQLPMTYDTSDAFWQRWIYLEFPYTFKTKEEIEATPEAERKNLKEIDPDIIEKITTEDELSGLLNWALDGLDRLIKQKNFSTSRTSEDIRIIWTRKSDSFKAFLMDCIIEDAEGKISKEDLRRAYHNYCKKYKLIPYGDKHVKNVLISEMGVSEERKMYSYEEFINCWIGIGFGVNIKGIKDIRGFYTYSEISNLHIDPEMGDTQDTLDISQVSMVLRKESEKIIEEEIIENDKNATELPKTEEKQKKVLDILSAQDEGSGVTYEVLKYLTNTEDDLLFKEIDLLRKNGKIFEIKPNRFKILR